MRFEPTALDGVIIVEPTVHRDSRGFFVETYHADRYREGGIAPAFIQDNHSRSVRGTLRGLHAQSRHPQGKLVRAVEGEIFDVAVDIRRGSPTFLHWVGVTLSADNFRQLFVPVGYAHGFCVTSEIAQVEYKCTDIYDPEHELRIAWDDPDIGIEWPIADPVLSAKDCTGVRARALADLLPEYTP